ncbi:secretion system effector C (SseC) like family protein, partial [Vibrio parahaemolyticus 10296]
SAPK